MLAVGARRSAACLLSKQSCAHQISIEQGHNALQRVALAYRLRATEDPLAAAFTSYRHATEPFQFQRSFATRAASRPKAHTGKAPAKPRTTRDKAKPAKKKTVKTASKPKPKKPAVKAKPKRAKKELTEDQKKRKLIRELKDEALKIPTKLPSTAFTVLSSELGKANNGIDGKAAAEKYKNLIPEELEHYNRIANENKTQNAEAYEKWIASMDPNVVRMANNARIRLKQLKVKGSHTKLSDPRQVKRSPSPAARFLKDRYASGDMKGIALKDASSIIAREWKELPTAEKEKYIELHKQASEEYHREVKRVYGRESRAKKPQAATAA